MSESTTPFDLVRMDVEGHPVLVIYGELDVLSSPKLHEALTEAISEGPTQLLLDMANVTFIDSSALGTLIVAQRHLAEAGGELRLVAVPAASARIFEITGLSERFQILRDLHEATEVAEGTERDNSAQ